jgi:hypothetical protein
MTTPKTSKQESDWEKEYFSLTNRLIGERVILDEVGGSYFSPGLMYEIMSEIEAFISKVVAEAEAKGAEKTRAELKDYVDRLGQWTPPSEFGSASGSVTKNLILGDLQLLTSKDK